MLLTAGCTYDSWLHRCHPCSRGLHHTSTFCEYTLLSGTASHWMNTWLVALGDGHNELETHLIGPAGDRDQMFQREGDKSDLARKLQKDFLFLNGEMMLLEKIM